MEINDPYLKYKFIVKKWENEFIKTNNCNPKKVISIYKFITIIHTNFVYENLNKCILTFRKI